MTFTYKLSRRLALGHLSWAAVAVGVFAACSGGEPTSPSPSATTDPLASVRIAPKYATIETHQVIRFAGTGMTEAGDSMAIAIEWTATGGNISPDGAFSASTTGNFRVVGKGKGHNKSDTSTVVVVPPQPTLVGIVVTPDPATVTEGTTVTFTASGTLNDGSTSPIGVVWSATGGTIDPGGTYKAGMTPGSYRVVATNTAGTIADTVPTTITEPTLARVELTPDTVTLTPGATRQFTAYGRTSTGDSIAIPVSFGATGGTVTSGGLYTAGQTTGTYRMIARGTTTSLADTSTVKIQPAPLTQLILLPAIATLAPGGTVQFQAYGRTSAGDSVSVQANYVATGGTISSGGLYTAGSSAGSFRVIATQAGGTPADTSSVTIRTTTSCTSTATMLCPGDSLQAKVNAQGPGATFTLQPGIYRMQTVTPKTGQVFIGQPGAVMSGAKLLSGWIQSGNTWYVTGQTQRFANNVGVCASGTACQFQEDVYRDNVLLTRVLSLSAVGPGRFYSDYAAQRIYVGDDPNGHTIEAAATEYAFEGSPQGAGQSVVIDGLIIEKYANPAQYGAIGHSNTQAYWEIRNCEIRYNHGGAIRTGGIRVINCRIHHNGEIGIVGGGGPSTLIQGCEIDHNNTVGFDPSWEAGGIKFAGGTITGVQVRNNYIHDNNGSGLWADGYNDQFVWDGNRVENNSWDGIKVEISYSGQVTNNIVTGNGFGNPNSVEGDGIMVYASGGKGLTISGNTVSGNKNGIVLIQANRGTGPLGPLVTQNVSVHDNIVTLGPRQRHGAYYYSGDTGLWTTDNNHFTQNTYNLQAADAAPFLWTNGSGNASLTESQWRSAGNDASGTFNR
jgi:parallel beta-helix repeat protein